MDFKPIALWGFVALCGFAFIASVLADIRRRRGFRRRIQQLRDDLQAGKIDLTDPPTERADSCQPDELIPASTPLTIPFPGMDCYVTRTTVGEMFDARASGRSLAAYRLIHGTADNLRRN